MPERPPYRPTIELGKPKAPDAEEKLEELPDLDEEGHVILSPEDLEPLPPKARMIVEGGNLGTRERAISVSAERRTGYNEPMAEASAVEVKGRPVESITDLAKAAAKKEIEDLLADGDTLDKLIKETEEEFLTLAEELDAVQAADAEIAAKLAAESAEVERRISAEVAADLAVGEELTADQVAERLEDAKARIEKEKGKIFSGRGKTSSVGDEARRQLEQQKPLAEYKLSLLREMAKQQS